MSVLRHTKRHQERLRKASLDEIYDDGFVFPMQIHNYQVKQFALTREDQPESHFDIIEINDARLGIAKANLERVDVLGLHCDYEAFVENSIGASAGTAGRWRTCASTRDPWDASPALRARIADDNAADIAFYEYAEQLYAHRRLTGRQEA